MATKARSKGKSAGLLAEISNLQPCVHRVTWHDVMAEEQPEQFNEIYEVVRDFITGGVTRRVFPSIAKLHKYLSGKDAANPRQPLLTISLGSFQHFVNKVRDGHVKAAKGD